MKFEKPAGANPIDREAVVGKPHNRIEGALKTTGRAPYAYERHDVAPGQVYGYIIGAAIAKGRIERIDTTEAKGAPGFIAIVTALDMPRLQKGWAPAYIFGGPVVQHYHQALAIVVAETFEQARAAASLVRVVYQREEGQFDLAQVAKTAAVMDGGFFKPQKVGDFDAAFASAPITIDQTYTTPNESHAMMEPHATIASWQDGALTVWTSTQMVAGCKEELVKALGVPPEKVRVDSPYIGGGFGGKLSARADVILAALAARAVRRPVKVALTRPLMFNNTQHRMATIQRVRIGAGPDGRIAAIAHDSVSGNLADGWPEPAANQTSLLYAGANRLVTQRFGVLDLPEGAAMRAPGEASGMLALEAAMDEMAEKIGMDPVQFRILNDTQVDPANPKRAFSDRKLIECLRIGADRFGWSHRRPPGTVRDGDLLIGMGVAAGIRDGTINPSAARVRLGRDGLVIVETDMTDIGTGSYTILAQTAAEMMGLPLDRVKVRLGDSDFPVSAGSGGQFGANSSTSGVYAACVKLREAIATKLGLNPASAEFIDGNILSAGISIPITQAAREGEIVAEDRMEYGEALAQQYQQSTFAAHFVDVGVDIHTGMTKVRRMLAVCSAGRIINPITARSQVIGAMTMGVGAALMEDMVVDKRFGYFVNHDFAGYEVPVHADIPHQEVIFVDGLDATVSPMKAKGVGELGLCGVGAAIANAVYNATGIRVRDYPITLDKLIRHLPQVA